MRCPMRITGCDLILQTVKRSVCGRGPEGPGRVHDLLDGEQVRTDEGRADAWR